MGSVNSTMSSDGILTIIVPRNQPASTISQHASSTSQPTSSTRVTFPKENNDMSQSQSQRERYVTINNQQQPRDGQDNTTDGATSHNAIRYPEDGEGVSPCQSYRRKPHGGYWKR